LAVFGLAQSACGGGLQTLAIDKSNFGRHTETPESMGQRVLDLGGECLVEGAGAAIHQRDDPFHRDRLLPLANIGCRSFCHGIEQIHQDIEI